MAFELRDYQKKAVDALYDYWAQGNGENPLIVAPTGSGKTAIIAQIVRDDYVLEREACERLGSARVQPIANSTMRRSLTCKAVHNRLHGCRLICLRFELDLHRTITLCQYLWSRKPVSDFTKLIFFCISSANLA